MEIVILYYSVLTFRPPFLGLVIASVKTLMRRGNVTGGGSVAGAGLRMCGRRGD